MSVSIKYCTPWQRRVAIGLGATAGILVTVRLAAAQLLKTMLYHPSKYSDNPAYATNEKKFRKTLATMHYELEDVHYELPGGVSQTAFLVRPEDGSVPPGSLWMFFGGNAMVAQNWFAFCHDLLDRELSDKAHSPRPAYLLVDYPGFGANDGEPTSASVLEASHDALRSALKRFSAPPSELNLFGHSLGSSAVAHLAANLPAHGKDGALASVPRIGRMILSAPFVNIEEMARSILFPGIPEWILRPFIADPWDTLSWAVVAAKAGWNITVVHGSRDEIVPQWMGKAVAAAAKRGGNDVKFIGIAGAGHNDILFSNFDVYANEIRLRIQSGL